MRRQRGWHLHDVQLRVRRNGSNIARLAGIVPDKNRKRTQFLNGAAGRVLAEGYWGENLTLHEQSTFDDGSFPLDFETQGQAEWTLPILSTNCQRQAFRLIIDHGPRWYVDQRIRQCEAHQNRDVAGVLYRNVKLRVLALNQPAAIERIAQKFEILVNLR